MVISGKNTDKLMFAILYAGILMFTAWGGARLIGYSLDVRFYNEYLIKWETTVRDLAVTQASLADFHQEQPCCLYGRAYGHDAIRPISPSQPLIPRDRMFIGSKKSVKQTINLFVLCLPNRIIVYGLSNRTFKTVDVSIDGGFDLQQGQFTGYPTQDGLTYTGRWQL